MHQFIQGRAAQRAARLASLVAFLLSSACTQADTAKVGRKVSSDGATSVSSPEAGNSAGESIRLVPIGRISGPREGTGFGQLGLVAMDSDANIIALDASESVVHQFNSAGSVMVSLGRRGAGPGEFAQLIGMVPERRGLWTVDGGNARYTLFANGAVLHNASRSSTTYRLPWFGGVGTDGFLYDAIVDVASNRDVLLKLDASGQVEDTIALPQLQLDLPRLRRMEFPLPYSPEVLRAFDPSGASFIARTDEYRLVRITFDGDTSGVVSRALDKRPLQKQQQDSIARVIAELAAELNVTVEASSIPQSFPLLAWCVVDDRGRLWIGLWDADGTVKVDVAYPDGSMQTDVPLPFRIIPGTKPAIAHDRFVGIEESATGEHQIRIARIETVSIRE